MTEADHLKENLVLQLKRLAQQTIEQAFEAGQAEDVTKYKKELEETLEHAQEAFEFIQVALNRISIGIEGTVVEYTTLSHIHKAREHLTQIKGVVK